MTPHEFLKEIYKDFCIKNNLPKTHTYVKGGQYLSADDYLNSNLSLTSYIKEWLENYIKLWEETNGGEDIDGTD